jgi:hypothetical protein
LPHAELKAARTADVISRNEEAPRDQVLNWVRTPTAAQRATNAGRKSGRCAGIGPSCGSQKTKLTEDVEQLVAERGHHLVDAEGMAGLELRPVDEGFVDEMVGSGIVNEEEYDESD